MNVRVIELERKSFLTAKQNLINMDVSESSHRYFSSFEDSVGLNRNLGCLLGGLYLDVYKVSDGCEST